MSSIGRFELSTVSSTRIGSTSSWLVRGRNLKVKNEANKYVWQILKLYQIINIKY